ncbi:uncharacterized protein MONBRDRAFT_14645 [Monosiga brevicollis MX1]|uniref:non-specific serine/threonine protein kinase n=1 Tax=Monosiga brevicollis TaxID=81824 RepID=A9US24_MONBE|nr:uncharacterized protein MONBRDRAFT_14645 [Monosiga brevicollis MX1]EDQ91704.1 predicted protein [Monosiga brevicollis MX1]|eukprot:XP_001742990.1 hypothetical protein [Monosiga brevicollis MX1]
MAGVAATRAHTNIQARILDHRASGQWTEALSCYEQALQEAPSLGLYCGMLECQLNLGHYQTVCANSFGLETRFPAWADNVRAYRVEAAWKLGDWDQLHQTLEDHADRMLAPHHPSKRIASLNNGTQGTSPVTQGLAQVDGELNLRLGQLLDAVRQQKMESLSESIQTARDGVVAPLITLARTQGSYQRMYPYLLQLHGLHEVEGAVHQLLGPERLGPRPAQRLEELNTRWQRRLVLADNTFKSKDFLLSLRRSVLQMLYTSVRGLVDTAVASTWELTARHARKAGLLDTAYTALLHVDSDCAPGALLEHARLLWDTGRNHEAIHQLSREIGQPNLSSDKEQHDAASLLVGEWMLSTTSHSIDVVRSYLQKLVKNCSSLEKSHYLYASYLDSLLSRRSLPEHELLPTIIEQYAMAVERGFKYTYHALPRLLTLWLEYGSRLPALESQRLSQTIEDGRRLSAHALRKGDEHILKKISGLVGYASQRISAQQLFTCLEQLSTHLTHVNLHVFEQVCSIIIRVVRAFPHQSLWLLLSNWHSQFQFRITRFNGLVDRLKIELADSDQSLLSIYLKISKALIGLCNQKVTATQRQIKLSKVAPDLAGRRAWNTVLVPTSKATTIMLPASTDPNNKTAPFPDELPYIESFESTVVIYPSKQQPKRIFIRGTDGHKHQFLCKQDEDIRKDSRFLNLCTVVNKFLRADPDSLQRDLFIQTYGVWPLSEVTGMIEWVPKCTTIRDVLSTLYRAKNLAMPGRELRRLAKPETHADKGYNEVDIFEKVLKARHPPVLREWFINQFPDPTSWYSARTRFARSSAVMSMLGYVAHALGLGDRHYENIMLDTTDGKVMHVDFDVIFEKGKTLRVKERVPFRLTHNMTDAMGATGHEGTFRKCCEISMRVLREQHVSIINVLEMMLYAPLLEWDRHDNHGGKTKHQFWNELHSTEGQRVIETVRLKLQGQMGDSTRLIPMSIEGQVDELIQEATDPKRLALMYIGWAPYM